MLRFLASICCLPACFAAALAFPSPPLLAAEPPTNVAAAAVTPQPTLEEELLLLVNHDRTERGFPPLEVDEALVRVAREQSRRMAAVGVISHDLPDSGALKARLDNAGYRYRSARENLARAGTVIDAQDALLSSPAHAANLFATDVTHVGIGVFLGPSASEDTLFITQIFTDPAVRPSVETIRETFLARVEQARKQNGLGALGVDPVLGQAAFHSLAELDSPINRGSLRELMVEAVRNLRQAQPARHGPSRVAADIQLVRDARELRVPAHLLQGDAAVFGAGVFEARDGASEPVVVLLSLVCLK